MSKLEQLIDAYRNHISTPWETGLAGAQRVIFAVYDKADELRLRMKIDEVAIVTKEAGHGWQLVDVTNAFAEWLGAHRYRASYFEDPDSLEGLSRGEVDGFMAALKERLIAEVRHESDAGTVTAVLGVGALFGVAKVSWLVEQIAPHILGRLLVFFPGEYANNNYRLLDARDGWNYLAVPLLGRSD